jgi:hypothetical protein
MSETEAERLAREIQMFNAVEGVLEEAGVPEFSTLADRVVDAIVALAAPAPAGDSGGERGAPPAAADDAGRP